MYEYKFEKVFLTNSMQVLQPLDDYQAIIHQHAQEGWRFVQIFAPSTNKSTGTSEYFEIIFERPITN